MFRLQVRVGRWTVPFDYRIVAFEPPTRVALVADRGTVRSEDTITIVSDATGGSTLTYDARLRLKGVYAIAEPLLCLGFRRIGDRGIAGLRRTLSLYAATGGIPAV